MGTDDSKQSIGGFRAVNWEKVTKLSDDVLGNWSRIGLIQLIHCHLQSIKRISGSQPAQQ